MLKASHMENLSNDEAAEPQIQAVPVEDVRGMFVIKGAFNNRLGYFDSLPTLEKASIEIPHRRKQNGSGR